MAFEVYLLYRLKLFGAQDNALEVFKLGKDNIKAVLRIITSEDFNNAVQIFKTVLLGLLKMGLYLLGTQLVLLILETVHLDQEFKTAHFMGRYIRHLRQYGPEMLLIEIQQPVKVACKGLKAEFSCQMVQQMVYMVDVLPLCWNFLENLRGKIGLQAVLLPAEPEAENGLYEVYY